MKPDGNLEEVFKGDGQFCAATEPVYGHSFKNNKMTFILPCNLMVLREGLHSVENIAIEPAPITPSQKNIKALSWKMNVNISDTLAALTVHHIGNSLPARDINTLTLIQKRGNPPQAVKQVDLESAPDGISFQLPAGSNFAILDGDQFHLEIELKSHALEGGQIQFEILKGKMSVITSDSFELETGMLRGPLHSVAPANLNPNDRIGEVLVYPTPAKKDVRFMYSLDAVSNVEILIYDRAGQRVSRITDENKLPDLQAVTPWDAGSLSSGVYFAVVKIQSSLGTRTLKSTVVIER
jgi:hypothetical protein